MSFLTYIAKRAASGLFIVVLVVLINFVLINLAPGDPAVIMGGEIALSSPEYINAIREKWGLDKPITHRLALYLYNVFVRGDLGYSYRYLVPVSKLILERLGYTLILTVTGSLLAFALALKLSVTSIKKGGCVDALLTSSSLTFWSIPMFWLAIMLVWVFSVNLKIFPAAGVVDVRNPKTGLLYALDVLHHSFLPILTLTIGLFPAFFKLLRDTMVEQLGEDYVYTFKAIGLDDERVIGKHVLRNALIPALTLLGLNLGYAIAGAALVEVVFGWPGIGRLLLDATYVRDYPVILGIFVIVACSVVVANIVVDALYSLLDPRVKVRT